MHTPVDVTGIEPATACLQSPGLSTFDHTLRFFFPDYRLGNLTQGRTDALCRPGASGSRDARPEPSYIGELLLQLASDCRSRGVPLSACLRGGTFDGLCLLS